MMGGYGAHWMSHSIVLHEVGGLTCHKLWVIVLHQLLGQPVCCEDPMHNSNGTSSGGGTHLEHFGPFWVCIHNDKEHLPEKEASEVHMNSLPWLGKPHSWLQRDHRWCTLSALTWNVAFEQAMDVLVESRLPGIAACNNLHVGHSRMVAVQFSQDSALKLLRNDHTGSPQLTVTLYNQFHVPVWSQTASGHPCLVYCIFGCSFAAAKVGMPFFGPRIVIRGLWSVTSTNCFHRGTSGISMMVPPSQFVHSSAHWETMYVKQRQ